ncbi:MAG: methionine adenosyltransferase [Methanomassiliicoccales archaeon]|uniref:methionine adenosyltransferase n=1 Tax=Candidatus Methanarcanum hacksteinii TaxID=2911857 RepID=UPI0026F5137C|nr:methionine adenosyltransferase [Candidatus Methanomethylophilaceae archaeon]MCI6024848.1 methionine adenosyltransferase [Methanomassiliicoccales archaeon]MDD7478986.1 methionine adenosyltransferase [Methanomassiliicoccales archaeon]MDO5838277.1 methionine adenosyltransferase [Methanomassiliicoccales archaeon]TQS78084.1 MAG: S-adenosylmethionine synthetase [Candidatus Methanarcanum hacksteinii]
MANKNIYVEGICEMPVPMRKIELVERKGIGHPDSVADALAEEVSKALCKMYKKEFGTVLHHNTDETQIAAGQASPKFGGGHIIDPSYILLVGRATTNITDVKTKDIRCLPCKPTALAAARNYLKKTFPNLDVDSEVVLDARLGQGSDDLRGVYKSSKILANDTSFGVGYAPYSITDRLVLTTEEYINGKMKDILPETGQDVKVMASRVGNDITMTVACAMVDKYIDDLEHYKSVVEQMYDKVNQHALDIIGDEKINFKLDINTGDDYDKGVIYLTCTGLSQEMGDDGSVGRGNRCNGLITPYRPMSMEATSGKNPITHIGKIYNVMSKLIAEDVAKKVSPEVEVRVRILSQIGKPVSEPLNCNIQLVSATEDKKIGQWKQEAESIAYEWLDNVDKVTDLIINGKVRTF